MKEGSVIITEDNVWEHARGREFFTIEGESTGIKQTKSEFLRGGPIPKTSYKYYRYESFEEIEYFEIGDTIKLKPVLSGLEEGIRICISCWNNNCKYYYEDLCMYAFRRGESIQLDRTGTCGNFLRGTYEAYYTEIQLEDA